MILNPTAPALSPTGISLMAGEVELPLEAVNITAHVDGGGVVWTVVQVFTNTMTEAAEAVYTFPLPNEGAVSAMSMTIGDRQVAAQIKKRDEARIEYEEAVAQGFTAGLLEQQAGEIFTMAVGNIHPGESISVTITVHDSVMRDGSDATVRMPTLVKERYVPAGTPNAEAITPPRHAGDVHVNSTVTVTFATPVADIVCDTVEGAAVSDQKLTISGFALDRDVVVRWQVPATILEAKWTPDADDPAMGTIEVDVRVEKTGAASKRKVVAITIDRSGSMVGHRIDLAKRVASDAIAGLNSNDLVHVAVFDDVVQALSAC